MTIVINGTTGISGVDGSAGTPAVQGTDTNTGVFYPAADTVGVSTGGSERMRVDSSGNVGIGTTNTTDQRLKVKQSADTGAASFSFKVEANANDTGLFLGYRGVGAATAADTCAILASYVSTGAFKPITFLTSDAERMRIDSSGNVGIGTSSPNYKLQIKAATDQNLGIGGAVSLTNAVAISAANDANSANVPMEMRYATNIAWYDGGTERMRINSSGNLLFNSGYGSVATAYGCRAWVNFNGTGTVAIRASGNVSSITDNGVGDYTLNFTTAMTDANYSVAGSASNNASSGSMIMAPLSNTTAPTTTAFRFNTSNSASNIDCPYIFLSVFR